MVITFIIRKKEQVVMQKALQSNEAEIVAAIGMDRRRIGKTFFDRKDVSAWLTKL